MRDKDAPGRGLGLAWATPTQSKAAATSAEPVKAHECADEDCASVRALSRPVMPRLRRWVLSDSIVSMEPTRDGPGYSDLHRNSVRPASSLGYVVRSELQPQARINLRAIVIDGSDLGLIGRVVLQERVRDVERLKGKGDIGVDIVIE